MRQIDLVKIYATKNCLVIDDMSEVRGTLTRMLRTFGIHDIDTAAKGEEGIEKCQEKQYDIVLCDYNLGPGKDGQQVLEELRFRNRLNNTSLFLMITAEAARDMVLGALEYRPDDYITKPFTQASLRQRMDRALLRHQALYGVKAALDEKDYQEAIERCDQLIAQDTPYQNACLQIKAEMNLRLLQTRQAEAIYDKVLEARPVVWAKLGMGKVKLAQREYGSAEQQLKEVIDVDRRFVEAHDLLAEAYLAQGDSIKAQKATQAAVEVSPKSVLRQRRLAALAKQNDDVEASLAARRRAIRLGQNSCYESAADYIDLTRELNQQARESLSDERQAYTKEAFETLNRLEKKRYFDTDALIQSQSLRARLAATQDKNEDASKYAAEARVLYSQHQTSLSPEASLEFAELMLEKGEKEEAQSILEQLASQCEDNEALLDRIDAASDSPISSGGRQKVADLTKRGIGHYEKKEFAEAVGIFKNAVAIFPNHIGLNLNLVQVTLAEAKIHGDQPGFERSCRKALKAVQGIAEDDPQFARYQFLRDQVDRLYPP